MFELIYTHPYLALVQGAFMVWMLIDASRRRADHYWFWVIIVVPVLGAWAYFFVVKAADFRRVHFLSLFQGRTTVAELRYRVEQVPTLANQLTLAERLIERHEYAEAVPFLEAARKREPEHSRVGFCLALCHARQGHAESALPLLEGLVKRDPRWSDYAAWRLLIETRAGSGDRAGALAACRELVRLAPTLQNRCLLAEHLLDEGLHEEARGLLERALQDHHFNPGPIRWRNRRWAGVARRLRKRVESC
jgi:hypothetical protein